MFRYQLGLLLGLALTASCTSDPYTTEAGDEARIRYPAPELTFSDNADLARKAREFLLRADTAEIFTQYPRSPFRDPKPAFVLTSPYQIRRLVPGPTLKPKEPCRCKHVISIRFHRDGESLTASICGHCYDVFGQEHSGDVAFLLHAHMTQAVWQTFNLYKAGIGLDR